MDGDVESPKAGLSNTKPAITVHLNADDFVVKNAPTNIRYISNFISEEEERLLSERVYAAPKPKWDTLKNRRLQSWGGLVGKNGLVSDGPLPDWLEAIIDRIMSVENAFSADRRPNHVLINEYLPGQGIMPHTDGSAFNPLISTISLGSSTFLDFYTPLVEGGTRTEISERYVGSMFLQPRSLVLINDHAYGLLHGIREATNDKVTEKMFNRPKSLKIGTEIPRQTRVSLTIRNVPNVKRLNVANLLQRK